MFAGLSLLPALALVVRTPVPQPTRIAANHVIELAFVSEKRYADPFNEVEVSARVLRPDGATQEIPAFWAGGQTWKVRCASGKPGKYTYRVACTDAANASLNGAAGEFEVTGYAGSNPLYRHGPVRVAADRRHFEHADGTPFFWLADTWWMGLCKRLAWPDEFRTLTKDRVKKGYAVVQIVAGLYPDMPAFDERGANEAGFPWTKDYSRIRPEYFDAADRRIAALVEAGLSPCIVGAWGYHMPWMGVDRLDKHWRYVVARYGAYPVIWCVAGEANLPYYLTAGFPFDDREQVMEWTKAARYLRSIDPFHRPLSIHPTGLGKLDARHAIDDVSLLDFDMLQTGHGDRSSLPPTVDAARIAYAGQPAMPFLNSEVCYEGILGACHDDVQRLMFWTCMLSGAAGHTYGANGIWQLNQPGKPYGKSPHGGDYGPVPWTEAMKLPGSGQLGMAKAFLERLEWWTLEPRPDGAAYADGGEHVAWGDWIWYPEGNPAEDAPVASRYFRKSFGVADPRDVARAILRVAADDRHVAYFNGARVSDGGGWSSVRDIDVTKLLHAGRNIIAVRGENGAAPVRKNPAGLLCTLTLQRRDGKSVNITTDSSWQAQNREVVGWEKPGFADLAWPSALVVAPYGGGPWGRVADSQPYLSPYAAALPDGAMIVYVPLAREVALRRLQSGRQYRLELFNPVSGRVSRQGISTADASGAIAIPAPAGMSDWVLVVRPESKKPESKKEVR